MYHSCINLQVFHNCFTFYIYTTFVKCTPESSFIFVIHQLFLFFSQKLTAKIQKMLTSNFPIWRNRQYSLNFIKLKILLAIWILFHKSHKSQQNNNLLVITSKNSWVHILYGHFLKFSSSVDSLIFQFAF